MFAINFKTKMAHFAQIDNEGTVTRVIVVADEHEADGEQWCADFLGGTWKQTSYNTRGGEHSEGGEAFRKNFAGTGFKYDSDLDAFIPPKPPFESWVLNETICQWEAPVPRPDGPYAWDEEAGEWVEVEEILDNSGGE